MRLGFDDFARTLRRERLYFTDVEADVAIFAAYPHIEKQDIERAEERQAQRTGRGRRKGRRKPAAPDGARGISERAGDEFT